MKRQIAVVACAAACFIVTSTLLAFLHSEAPTKVSQRTLAFAQRVAYQRAIEDVQWRHRIWPQGNAGPKPALDKVMSQAQIEKKVEDYLTNSQTLEHYWLRPLTAEQLQAEMDRMARDTKQPEVLRELSEALGNDPFVIAECLAKPALVERDFAVAESRTPALEDSQATLQTKSCYVPNANYTLPTISYAATACTPDTWTSITTTHAPLKRYNHTAVWTGSEMIVWGGFGEGGIFFNTGGRYNPATDNWTRTSTTNAPGGREFHTAVWTGTEMIVWVGKSPASPTAAAGTIPARIVGQPPARPVPPLACCFTRQCGPAMK